MNTHVQIAFSKLCVCVFVVVCVCVLASQHRGIHHRQASIDVNVGLGEDQSH